MSDGANSTDLERNTVNDDGQPKPSWPPRGGRVLPLLYCIIGLVTLGLAIFIGYVLAVAGAMGGGL